ncbi:MAG: DUF2147 domain-containing protein [Alphaproteobacteria bacterium]
MIMKNLAAWRGAASIWIAATTSAWAQADIMGRWVPPEQDSVIEVYPCGEQVCGRITHLNEPLADGKPKVDINNRDETLRSRPILGMQLLEGFVQKGPGDFREGRIYNPRDGKLYKAVITLLDDGTLKLRGYVGVPALGKTQIWNRPSD